jgi:hypothetical protein
VTVGLDPSGFDAFIGPSLIVASGGPLSVTADADFDTLWFRSHVNFHGGTLRLTSNLTTNRTITVLPTGGTIDTGSFTGTLSGAIGDTGALAKVGTGTLVVAGTAAHSATRVAAGRLLVTGTHTGDVDVTVGELAGTGMVGRVIMAAPVAIIRPGDNGPGELHASQVVFTPGSTLAIELNGPTAGTQYDRLTTTGVTPLADATLSVSLGYAPPLGTSFTIATHTSGTFAGLPEGARLTVNGQLFSITYVGGAGPDVVLTRVTDTAPTLTGLSDRTMTADTVLGPLPFTIGDDWTAPAALVVAVTSSNHALVPDANVVLGGSGASRTLTITPLAGATGATTITVSVTDDAAHVATGTFQVTVAPAARTYYLSEGATGAFFNTDLLLANPTATPAPVTLAFLREDGTTVSDTRTLAPTSRTTINVDAIAGLEATTFSIVVTSTGGVPIAVERTMWWDWSRYGAHTEKASEGTATEWLFAEGAGVLQDLLPARESARRGEHGARHLLPAG